jgi:membrane-bound metal-dependent hydrolase YbcI (DUF457 family)
MLGRSHLLVGAAGYLTVGQAMIHYANHRPLTPGELVAGTVVCAGAAMLPDIDHPNATVSRALGPVTWFASRAASRLFGGHRVGTHSLPFAALMSLLVAYGLAHVHSQILAFFLCFFFTSLCVRVMTEADGAVCAVISAGVASAMIMGAPGHQWLADAIGLGCLLHIAADGVTTEGICLMWPLSREKVRFPICGNTGGMRERGVAICAGLLTVWFYAHLVILPNLFH